MAAAEQRVFTQEETLRLLGEKSKDADEFYLKVFRRAHIASMPEMIAAFTGAQMAHFTNPELWLPQLAGGGKLMLLGYHQSDLNKPVGSYITFSISEDARDVDIGVTKKSGWRGPPVLEFPKEAERRAVSDMPLYEVRSPPAPGSGDSATRTHAWPRPAGGGQRPSYEDDGIAFGPRAAALEAERRKLEAEKLEAERERHKAELLARDAAHKAEMAALKSELRDEFRRAEKPTGPDPTQALIAKMIEQQAEDRRVAEQRRIDAEKSERDRQDRFERERKEERQAERDREERRERERKEDARKDQERFEKMMEKLAGDRKDPLELLEKAANIVGKKSNDSDALVKSVHNMVEMQSSTMGMAMDFVDHVSRMQLGGGNQEEPSWVKGIDRLMKGIGKMAMTRGGAPTLPPAAQTVPGQAQQQQPQAQQQAQQAPPVIDQIINAIRVYHPPAQVAAAIIHYYKDPSLQAAIAEAGGDFELAFKNKLGNWIDENHNKNKPYMDALITELEKQLQKAGFYADDSAEPEAEDEGTEEEAQVEEGDEEKE